MVILFGQFVFDNAWKSHCGFFGLDFKKLFLAFGNLRPDPIYVLPADGYKNIRGDGAARSAKTE
jgi:hypothetical protein